MNIAVASAQQDTTNFLTYTNTDLGFTMKYPSGWTIKNPDSSSTMFNSSDDSSRVIVTVINAGGSLNDLSTFLSQHPFAGGTLLEFNSNNYSLSSHHAIRTITIQSFGSPPAIKSLTYGTILADKTYFVTYAAQEDKFPEHLQTAQSMIDSFQIISKQ